jgi:hypothetical protein
MKALLAALILAGGTKWSFDFYCQDPNWKQPECLSHTVQVHPDDGPLVRLWVDAGPEKALDIGSSFTYPTSCEIQTPPVIPVGHIDETGRCFADLPDGGSFEARQGYCTFLTAGFLSHARNIYWDTCPVDFNTMDVEKFRLDLKGQRNPR